MIANCIEKLGMFEFDKQNQDGKKITHAGCLSRALPEEKMFVPFIVALSAGVPLELEDANVWTILQNIKKTVR